jgi:hypothetical protein
VSIEIGVTSEHRPMVWRVDWACPTCARYGFIRVEVTGGPRNEKTGKLHPKTSDEEFHRKVWEAHREATSGICVADVRHILIGPVMWRWQRTARGKEFIIRVPDGQPQIKEYAWPPRRPPWAAK